MRRINVRSIMQLAHIHCSRHTVVTLLSVRLHAHQDFRLGYFLQLSDKFAGEVHSTKVQAVACAGAFLRLAVLALPTATPIAHVQYEYNNMYPEVKYARIVCNKPRALCYKQ